MKGTSGSCPHEPLHVAVRVVGCRRQISTASSSAVHSLDTASDTTGQPLIATWLWLTRLWADGPNMACEACGLPVASRIDDCSLWQAVWLAPNAVRRFAVDNANAAPLSGAELMADGKGTPPFELIAEVVQRALDALLPAGPPAGRALLAGPGRPPPPRTPTSSSLPAHPQTGETWTPTNPATPAYLVPLPFGVWLWLAFLEPYLPIPAAGGMPNGFLRDDPPAPRTPHLFRAGPGTFQHALVRLPAVHSRWLREILENLTQHMRARLF